MSNRPQFGNNKVTIQKDMHEGIEYKVDAWLQIDNGWDKASNRPIPMTPEQQQAIDTIYRELVRLNARFRLEVKQKEGSDARAFPRVGSFNMFVNKPREDNVVPMAPRSSW